MTSNSKCSVHNCQRLSEELQSINNELNKFDECIEMLDGNQLVKSSLEMLTKWRDDSIKLNGLFAPSDRYFRGDTLLSLQHQYQLNSLFQRRKQIWNLIYKGTRDGFTRDMYKNCQVKNRKCILFVIKSKEQDGRPEYLFGTCFISPNSGIPLYTISENDSSSQPSVSSYSDGSTTRVYACIYTLTNPYNIKPTAFQIKRVQSACYGSKHRDLVYFQDFSQDDIIIGNHHDEELSSYFNFPENSIDTTGRGCELFTGGKYFKVNEIEAYETDLQ